MSKPKKGKRFVYSLETLLKVREIRERKEKDKLTEAEKVLHEEKLKEAEAKQTQSTHLAYVRELLGSDNLPELTYIQMHQEHVKVLQKRVVEQQQKVQESEKKRDDQREEVVKATKEKEIIEKDKDKTREAWKKMMAKIDAQFLDEIASIKFANTMRENQEEIEHQRRLNLKKNRANEEGI